MLNERIKSERKRLNLNQAEFAKECGVSLRAQCNYEKGERVPDCHYLQKAHKLGVDTNYLITGEPKQSNINQKENLLLQNFRNLSKEKENLLFDFFLGGIEKINNKI